MDGWKKYLNAAIVSSCTNIVKHKEGIKSLKKAITSFPVAIESKKSVKPTHDFKSDFKKEIVQSNVVFTSIALWKKVSGGISPKIFTIEKERKFVYKYMPLIGRTILKIQGNREIKKEALTKLLKSMSLDSKNLVGKKIDFPKVHFFCNELIRIVGLRKTIPFKHIASFFSFLFTEFQRKTLIKHEQKNVTEKKSIDSINKFLKKLDAGIVDLKLSKSKDKYDIKNLVQGFEEFLLKTMKQSNPLLLFIDFEDFFGNVVKRTKGSKSKAFGITKEEHMETFINGAMEGISSLNNESKKDIEMKTNVAKTMISYLSKKKEFYSMDIIVMLLLVLSICFVRGILFLDKV